MQPINLGNPVEITIEELVYALERVTGSSLKKKYFPLPQNDPLKRQPDISQARKLLDWLPIVDLEAGLSKTIEYHTQVHG